MNYPNALKKDVFGSLMDLAGRVFVVVKYSDNVSIGRRGFSEDEKENGITLVFNSAMTYLWDDFTITATLSFGSTAEKCIIPISDIIAIFSPEVGVQMIIDPERFEAIGAEDKIKLAPHIKKHEGIKIEESSDEKIIKVDFNRHDD
jgi:stringent starvation protein B